MVNFGVTRTHRARNTYLGHKVLGDATTQKQGERKKLTARAQSKLEVAKHSTDPILRIKSLSKQRRFGLFNLEEDDEQLMLRTDKPVGLATKADFLGVYRDDCADDGLILSDDEEKDKQLNPLLTRSLQFGAGGDAQKEEDKPESRKRRLAELMETGRQKRVKQIQDHHEQLSLLEEANEVLQTVLSDLDFKPTRRQDSYAEYVQEEVEQAVLLDKRSLKERERDADFDSLISSLVSVPKGVAADRLKTREEIVYEKERQNTVMQERMRQDMAVPLDSSTSSNGDSDPSSEFTCSGSDVDDLDSISDAEEES